MPARLHRADIIEDVFGGAGTITGLSPVLPARDAVSWSICATAPPACRESDSPPRGERGRKSEKAMAGRWIGRANSQGSGRFFHPLAEHDTEASRLCRIVGFRH